MKNIKTILNKVVIGRNGAYVTDEEARALKQGVRGGKVEVDNKAYLLRYKKEKGKTKAYLK